MVNPPTETVISFWLDRRDRIESVCSSWNDFASANEGHDCLDAAVLGRPLLDFVSGGTTKMLVSNFMLAVRDSGRALAREYRCDSPATKRFMEMRLSLDEGRLQFEHRVLRVEPLRPAVRFRWSETRGVQLVRCSMCNRVKVDDGWWEPDLAHARGLVDREVAVIYGVCEGCVTALRERRAQFRARTAARVRGGRLG